MIEFNDLSDTQKIRYSLGITRINQLRIQAVITIIGFLITSMISVLFSEGLVMLNLFILAFASCFYVYEINKRERKLEQFFLGEQ